MKQGASLTLAPFLWSQLGSAVSLKEDYSTPGVSQRVVVILSLQPSGHSLLSPFRLRLSISPLR